MSANQSGSVALQLAERLKESVTNVPDASAPPQPLATIIANQESALLARLFQRLTEPTNEMDMLPSEVGAIFRHYSTFGDKLNATLLSAPNARKLVTDIGLHRYFGKSERHTQAIVDVLFTRVIRGDAAKAGILHILGESKGLTAGFTFPWFLARIALHAWHAKLLASLSGPSPKRASPSKAQASLERLRNALSASPSRATNEEEEESNTPKKKVVVQSLILPSGEDATVEAIVRLLVGMLAPANRIYEAGDVEDLLSPSAVEALKRGEGVLQRIFYSYTQGRDRSIIAVDFATLAKICTDFNILPGLLSKPALFNIFLTASPAQTPVLYPGFVECMGRVALQGFSRAGFGPSLPSPGDKIDALFDRMMAAADKLAEMVGKERQKGLSPAHPDRLLNPEAGYGEAPLSSRRVSMANAAMAEAATYGSAHANEGRALGVHDAGPMSVENVSRRRNSSISAVVKSPYYDDASVSRSGSLSQRASTPQSARRPSSLTSSPSMAQGDVGFVPSRVSAIEENLNRSVSSSRRIPAPSELAATAIDEHEEEEDGNGQPRQPPPPPNRSPVPPLRSLASPTSSSSDAGAQGRTAAAASLNLLEAEKMAFDSQTGRRATGAGVLARVTRASITEAQRTGRTGTGGAALGSPPLHGQSLSATQSPERTRRATGIATPLFSSALSPLSSRFGGETAATDNGSVATSRTKSASLTARDAGIGYNAPGMQLAGSLAASQLAIAQTGRASMIPLPAAAVLATSVAASREHLVPTGRASLSARGAGFSPGTAAATAIMIAKAAGATQPPQTAGAHSKQTSSGFAVDPRVVDKLCLQFAPYISKVKPIFLFYSRIGDPSNTGRMSYTNFFRLMRDIDAVDDSVSTGDIHLQLATIARDNAAAQIAKETVPELMLTSKDTDSRSLKRHAAAASHSRANRAASAPPRSRPLAVSKSAPVATTEAVGLTLNDFFEALVRVSELIRRAYGQSEATSADSDRGDESAARDFFHTMLGRRILPLLGLSAAEEETTELVESPAVVRVVTQQGAFLKRLFAFYANDQENGAGVALYWAEFLQFTKDFELVPSILSRSDVETVFFTCARHAGTDFSANAQMGKGGASGAGGTIGSRRADASYNSGLVTALSTLFTSTSGRASSVGASPAGKRKGGGALEAAALSSSYRQPDTAYLSFTSFAEAVARLGVVGFSKPYLNEKFPTAADKTRGLFQWLYSARAIADIEAADWSRGRSRGGRHLTRSQLSGGFNSHALVKTTHTQTTLQHSNAPPHIETDKHGDGTGPSAFLAVVDAVHASEAAPSPMRPSDASIPPPPSPAAYRSIVGHGSASEEQQGERSGSRGVRASFSHPSLRQVSISSVTDEHERQAARSGLDIKAGSWRRRRSSGGAPPPPQQSGAPLERHYSAISTPEKDIEELGQGDQGLLDLEALASAPLDVSGSSPSTGAARHVSAVPPKPAAKATPEAPKRPQSVGSASHVHGEASNAAAADAAAMQKALSVMMGTQSNFADLRSPAHAATRGPAASSASHHSEVDDYSSSMVDGYELADESMSSSHFAGSKPHETLSIHRNTHAQGALHTSNVAYDYTVASVKVGDLGVGSPSNRYTRQVISGKGDAPASAPSLFAPGELHHYSRLAVARGQRFAEQTSTALRVGGERSELDPTGFIAAVTASQGALGQPAAVDVAARLRGPDDPALAAIHRSEFVKAVAADVVERAYGEQIRHDEEARSPRTAGSPTVPTAPRLHTAERASAKKVKEEFEASLAQSRAVKQRRASASALHELEDLMSRFGLSSQSISDEIAALTGRNGGNTTARNERVGPPPLSVAQPPSPPRLVKLPDGRLVDPSSLRSPLAGESMSTWSSSLRSPKSSPPLASPQRTFSSAAIETLHPARASPAASSKPTPARQYASPRTAPATATPAKTAAAAPAPNTGRRQSWITKLAESTPAVEAPAAPATASPASAGKVKTLVTTKSFRGTAASHVPPKTLPGWANTVASWSNS